VHDQQEPEINRAVSPGVSKIAKGPYRWLVIRTSAVNKTIQRTQGNEKPTRVLDTVS